MKARLEAILAPRLAGFGLSPGELLSRDAPGGLAAPGRFSANRHCGLMRARDGWVALNLARPDDVELVVALAGGAGDPWQAVAAAAARENAAAFRDRAIALQLPVAVAGEATPLELDLPAVTHVPRRVLDMSALWAGPLCGGLLARAGAEVVRVESIGRPDPTPHSSPRLNALINAGKSLLPLDLREAAGRGRLWDEVAKSDVLITSGRPAALARLGLEPEMFPQLTWVAITAHGFTGAGALRVGFGDDCAAAGGLLDWHAGEPRFFGDALADPLTGLEAARAVVSGRGGLIDMPMARVAASYAGMLR